MNGRYRRDNKSRYEKYLCYEIDSLIKTHFSTVLIITV